MKDEEHNKKILEVTTILKNISQTTIIPRNIRRTADSTIETLKNKDLTPGVRAANAVSTLNEILHDPNMPSFARVKIWNVIGILETIQD
ncbi:MAG: hypothetical protein GTN80_05720 [Nitrososphaeria archaeon]|nr:hypothetical protein [Nitrososphaeria archaeon]NIN52647.1 hypothetical protein [Nitrososphaeria archaeon]NIQ33122.1 hypothetical protein [Nitrososphaeria archaeon]